jgi:glycosyltransferase involved in cell wall biosynthesis
MCVLGGDGARDFIDRLDERGVPHSLIAAGPDLNPALLGSLWRELRAFRPDLVHTHLIHADLHGQLVARLAGIPGVSSVHSTHDFYGRQPYRSAATIAGRSARVTIAISDHVQRFLERLHIARPGGVRTVHYGIDASQWPSPASARARARERLGLGVGDVAVGIASRLVPHKGHDLLLRAHADAACQAPGMRLLIAGDGPMRGALERRALSRNGAVQFLGFVADVRSFMGACDVIVFPSLPEFGEGFGLAALEAMACEVPVVASRVGGLPEVVEDGISGFLRDPDDVDGMAAAATAILRDPVQHTAFARAGLERVRRHFCAGRVVPQYEAYYEKVIHS